MKKRNFGTLPTGAPVTEYFITNGDITASVLDFGAILRTLCVFGRDVVGGFDRIEGYLEDDSHQGGLIGRVANRIEDACFEMDGIEYRVTANEGKNCLHGGNGFDRREWQLVEHGEDRVSLSYVSQDGEEGFPGRVEVVVEYRLTADGLYITYDARAEGKTPISLTNHAYFNLDGLGGDIREHRASVYADEYTVVNGELIPTGERRRVEGTALDLRAAKPVGEAISAIGGIDHNYILSSEKDYAPDSTPLRLAATVENADIRMSVYTDRPCVQVYTGNFLGIGPDFKGGVKQVKHGALCIEAQTEPNGVKHGMDFFKAGETYTQATLYKFERV